MPAVRRSKNRPNVAQLITRDELLAPHPTANISIEKMVNGDLLLAFQPPHAACASMYRITPTGEARPS